MAQNTGGFVSHLKVNKSYTTFNPTTLMARDSETSERHDEYQKHHECVVR